MRGWISATVLLELDVVALDQRVGEQPLAHALDTGARVVGARRLDFEIDDASNARVADQEPELAQRLSTASP